MNDFDALPYDLHSGRELELMLLGVKPLASFTDEYPADPCEEIIPEAAFRPHVQSGKLEQREYVELLVGTPPQSRPDLKGFRCMLYSLPGESWRMDAYIEMKARARVSGWSEELERLEGSLLGYEDWQTDAWIDMLLARPQAKHVPWLARLARRLG
ncbi:hypothetical protein [Roseateles saccharophilus]|uniref:Uncharacterized protein n=1 Tax=Roseateles saccharophilus TaxID=304 RepID=A0A4R3V1I2_ROSSA|nr:hypothetical protein [Roseateles saccharophilus]MDG0831501.1 hypothetical protein [Roseateles saccharophilus]TCU98615.1 hypothetical protein EV671_101064 [Roseateles saccharophilus]